MLKFFDNLYLCSLPKTDFEIGFDAVFTVFPRDFTQFMYWLTFGVVRANCGCDFATCSSRFFSQFSSQLSRFNSTVSFKWFRTEFQSRRSKLIPVSALLAIVFDQNVEISSQFIFRYCISSWNSLEKCQNLMTMSDATFSLFLSTTIERNDSTSRRS